MEWQERRQKLLDSDAIDSLELTILHSTHEELVALARERECSEEEAARLALVSGLAYLRGTAAVSRVERADTPEQVRQEFEETTRQMMEEASHAAALKFQAYRLAEDNHVLEMHENAMKNTVLMQQHRMDIYREDEERLKQRIRELEAEIQRLRSRLPEDGATPAERHKGGRPWSFLRRQH